MKMFKSRVPQSASVVYYLGLFAAVSCGNVYAKESHKVFCSEDLMRVEIGIPDDSKGPVNSRIYLEGLKDYPDERCQPEINSSLAEFRLSLSNFYECGVTRMVNQLTGKKVYYHKIIIESGSGKEIVSVKCITSGPIYNVMMNESSREQPRVHHAVVRRDVLPAGFQEPEDLEITTSLTERAPEPRLSIGVSQNGNKVADDLTVSPGTPLTMAINLDRDSAPVYGLGVNYLEVTDTRLLSETIIFKGCTVDPYLFENFNTIDGDVLSARFKAFKFPDTSYVQFRATVNVCLDKCLGTQCSNGQIGYGRRRRDITEETGGPIMDNNKVFEISLATFIKINDTESKKQIYTEELEEKLKDLKMTNQRLGRNSVRGFGEVELVAEKAPFPAPLSAVHEVKEHAYQAPNGAPIYRINHYAILLLPIYYCLYNHIIF